VKRREFITLIGGAGSGMDRYSFIVSDLHRLLVAGLPAHCKRFWTLPTVGSGSARTWRISVDQSLETVAARVAKWAANQLPAGGRFPWHPLSLKNLGSRRLSP
jgi:hypothetical protein